MMHIDSGPLKPVCTAVSLFKCQNMTVQINIVLWTVTTQIALKKHGLLTAQNVANRFILPRRAQNTALSSAPIGHGADYFLDRYS